MCAAPIVEVRCAGCARTPLLGEWATLHAGAKAEAWLCELCERDPRRSRGLGEPTRRARIRSVAISNVRRVA